MHVQVGFGKVNLPTHLATYAVFGVVGPFDRKGAVNLYKRISGWARQPVGTIDVRGELHTVTIDPPEGSILLVQSSHRRNGVAAADAAIFLKLRSTGPLISIVGKLPVGRENTYGPSHTLFTGNADILYEEDFCNEGIEVPESWWDKFVDPEQIDECFTVSELMAERAHKPELAPVVSSTGIVMKPVPQFPRRRMNVRSRT